MSRGLIYLYEKVLVKQAICLTTWSLSEGLSVFRKDMILTYSSGNVGSKERFS